MKETACKIEALSNCLKNLRIYNRRSMLKKEYRLECMRHTNSLRASVNVNTELLCFLFKYWNPVFKYIYYIFHTFDN